MGSCPVRRPPVVEVGPLYLTAASTDSLQSRRLAAGDTHWKAKLPTVFFLLVSSLSCVAAGCVSVSLRVSGVSGSGCLPRGISPPTEAGSLGCSGPGPPRTPTTATRVSPVSPPVFRPATHQLVTDVWLGCSLWVEACQWLQGATGGKHVVVPPQHSW